MFNVFPNQIINILRLGKDRTVSLGLMKQGKWGALGHVSGIGK